jgi:DNA-binding LacI/PurR family transcriptional regulator
LPGLGHRRLALIVSRVSNAGTLAIETGVRQAISKATYAKANISVVSVSDEPLDVCRAIDRLLGTAARPSIFIGARAAATLTAFSHLMRLGLGLRVPQDISLLSVEGDAFLDMAVPRIARYEISPAQIARNIAWAILRPSAPHADAIYLAPKFVRIDSLQRLVPQVEA